MDVDENIAVATDEPDVQLVKGTPSGTDRLTEALAACVEADRALRVRCELRLLNVKTGQYAWWPESSWMLDLKAEDTLALQLRDALGLVFARFGDEGIQRVVERLTKS